MEKHKSCEYLIFGTGNTYVVHPADDMTLRNLARASSTSVFEINYRFPSKQAAFDFLKAWGDNDPNEFMRYSTK